MESTTADQDIKAPTVRIVIIGLGMVGLSFIEKMLEYDTAKKYTITAICEEPFVAYNRVGVTQYFAHRSVDQLIMKPEQWYQENGISVLMHHRATRINSGLKVIEAVPTRESNSSGTAVTTLPYDICIIATGSNALLPPLKATPGLDLPGVYVYRTIDDLNLIIERSKTAKHAAVVGGGLLGLEAAKATVDLGLTTTIYERNSQVLARQLDSEGAAMVLREIEKLGIKHNLGNPPVAFMSDSIEDSTKPLSVSKAKLQDGSIVEHDMVVFAIGISARDEIARDSGIECHARGGVLVNNFLETSAQDVYAIGEAASHDDKTYGLVAPGYDMAEVVARNLTRDVSSKGLGKAHQPRQFTTADMSTKLKLLGVHVASFGDYFANSKDTQALTYRDPFDVVYKKYIFTKDGKHLLGGMMVGDTTDYGKLLGMSKSKKSLQIPPGELILGV
ncbi:hypothetical protein BGZ72_002582, partial [Mortierella alpina]